MGLFGQIKGAIYVFFLLCPERISLYDKLVILVMYQVGSKATFYFVVSGASGCMDEMVNGLFVYQGMKCMSMMLLGFGSNQMHPVCFWQKRPVQVCCFLCKKVYKRGFNKKKCGSSCKK